MNDVRRFVSLVALVVVLSSIMSSQTTFRSVASGNWGVAATWEISTDGGSTWAAASSAPGQADSSASFVISAGDTVKVEASPKYCGNLTVEAGAMLYAGLLQPTSSIRYIRIKGSSLHVDGTFGYDADPSDSSDVLSLEPRGDSTLTITGAGRINISRIRPNSGRSNSTVVFDTDATITYAGSGGTGGAGIYSDNGTPENFTVTINAGDTVIAVPFCNIATASSTASDGGTSTTFNIDGTLIMQGGHLSLRSATGVTTTVNVAGSLILGGDLLPSGTTGENSIINVTGTMQMATTTGRKADFTDPDQFVSGSGTFILGPGAELRVGAPDGLNATTGPIRTTTVDFDAAARYRYTGSAAQVTGAQLPAAVAELTIENAAGVTLSQNVTVDTTLRFNSGNLATGSDAVTVGALGSISRTSGHVVGTLTRLGVSASQSFAVGTATDYAPVTVSPVAGSGDVTVKAMAGAHANPPASLEPIGLYWNLAATGITESDVTFGYPASLVPGGEESLIAARYTGTGTTWDNMTTSIDAGANTATVAGVTSFSDWMLAWDPYNDPSSLSVKNAVGVVVDGQLTEAEWASAPTLVYGLGAFAKTASGEYTVTAGVDVKNPFNDAGTDYSVPHTDGSVARVRVLREGLNLFIGIESDDKSIGKFDWEGDGLFVKVKDAAGADVEYKLYWQNTGANKDTMKYEEPSTMIGSGSGWGVLASGSTVNDTTNVDSGYVAELRIDLAALGYQAPFSGNIQVAMAVFDPDGFQHPMNAWHHTIGSFYKSWWGSEWGGTYRNLGVTVEQAFSDPASIKPKTAANDVTLDGQLNEADWDGAPSLVFGADAQSKAMPGDLTVTAAVDVKSSTVPHTDNTFTRVKFLVRGASLYFGIDSDDKSICKFDWEADGIFMKVKNAAGVDKEFKLYYQNIAGNKDTMRFEPTDANTGDGWGYLRSGSTVNDTLNVDSGYTAELRVDLDKLGYAPGAASIQVMMNIFDPDGFQHPMNAWDTVSGSFYKSWWGSEWGGVYRTLTMDITTGVGEEIGSTLPTVFALGQNYPNPFNPATTIAFDIPVQSNVVVKVYDVMGREVATLIQNMLTAGSHQVPFVASHLSSGVYLYRMTATPVNGSGAPFTAARKLMLLK